MPDEISNKTDFAKELINSFLNNAISEMSGLAAGAVAGHVDNKSMGNENMKIDRQAFMNEVQLRNTIREALILRRDKKLTVLKEEKQLRGYIRAIIKEAKQDFNYGNTGLNKLGAFLQAKKPLISSEYKQLQTDRSQREAFEARLLDRSESLFDELDAKLQAGEQSADLEEDMNVSFDEPVNDKLLPGILDTEQPKNKKKKEADVKIEPTGEREASQFFDNYSDEITSIYTGLDNPKDRQMFRDYYMSNVAAIMDQAEAEASNVAKPVDTNLPDGAQTAVEPAQQ
jgi:hypothetical protein